MASRCRRSGCIEDGREAVEPIALLILAQAFYLAALRLSRGFRPGGSWIPVLCLLLTCLGIELYMAVKGWFGGSAGKAIAAAILGFAVLLTLWAAPGSQARELWNRCIHPEAYAANSTAWDDSYNNMLIRELLSRAKNFGEVQLSREELLNYGTGEWYYGKNGAGHWKDQRIGETSGEDSHFPALRPTGNIGFSFWSIRLWKKFSRINTRAITGLPGGYSITDAFRPPR